jgi:hypothetical protein
MPPHNQPQFGCLTYIAAAAETAAAAAAAVMKLSHQTTAHTICWTLFLLATHPEAEARLCAELDSLGLLATPDRPRPAAMQWEQLAQVGGREGAAFKIRANLAETQGQMLVGSTGKGWWCLACSKPLQKWFHTCVVCAFVLLPHAWMPSWCLLIGTLYPLVPTRAGAVDCHGQPLPSLLPCALPCL